MSLIDLPGMTRIPVKGQPDDIAERLERLIMSYIRNPSCIILAVSAANTDLANSDAIALSRSVDPEGLRTIGTHQLAPVFQGKSNHGSSCIVSCCNTPSLSQVSIRHLLPPPVLQVTICTHIAALPL